MKIKKVLIAILAVISIALASYGLITKDFDFMPYLLFALGMFVLIIGVVELKAKRKINAVTSFFAAAFAFFVAVYTFLS